MSSWQAPKGPRGGGCLCGSVRFECRSVYDVIYCHCSICRRWSGEPVMLTANIPTADFSITQGTPATYSSSEKGRRHFCPTCGTHLHFSDDGPYVGISPMAFDDASDIVPRLHQCSASKVAWFEIADDLPHLPENKLPAPGREP